MKVDLSDDEITRLVEMRGGCRCHLSPPCGAHADPPTADELAELRDDDKPRGTWPWPTDSDVED